MDIDIQRRLQTVSQTLHLRAIEHSPGPDQDTRNIMQGLAIAMEALQQIAMDVSSLQNGLDRVEAKVKHL